MNCLKCALPLVQKQVKGRPIEADYCQHCHGIWFDEGELSPILGLPARNLSAPANARRSALQCPRCAEPLVMFAYPGTMTVIDACRTCRGVWLDGGEFQELAKHRPASAAAPPRPQPQAQAAETAAVPEVAGVKGQLTGFINRSIESLWAGIWR